MNLAWLTDLWVWLGWACSLLGAFFLVVAGVGILRLPDAYCRAHALGKAMTLGLGLLFLAMGFTIPDLAWWKVALAIVFQFVTIPVASHLFCLIAYRRGVTYWSERGWTNGKAAGKALPPQESGPKV